MKVAVFITMLVVLAMVKQGRAIDCKQVVSTLAPCLPYLTSSVGNPSSTCCNGVRNLKAMAPTTPDRQAACQCAKQAASRYKIKADSAAQLPQKCRETISVPITKDVDCSKIT